MVTAWGHCHTIQSSFACGEAVRKRQQYLHVRCDLCLMPPTLSTMVRAPMLTNRCISFLACVCVCLASLAFEAREERKLPTYGGGLPLCRVSLLRTLRPLRWISLQEHVDPCRRRLFRLPACLPARPPAHPHTRPPGSSRACPPAFHALAFLEE